MNGDAPPRELGPRFAHALHFAHEAHRTQARKGTDEPYISHLLAVTSLVLEHGGDEAQAIAALLHDAPEDQGGAQMLSRIGRDFGAEISQMVDDCTEPKLASGLAWRERKERYLDHLAKIPARSVLIVGCDKVHNASALLRTLVVLGPMAFDRFNGKAEGTRWWYGQLSRRLGDRLPRGLAHDLERLAHDICEY